MDLEPSSGFSPIIDRRPRMDEPLPVRLVAVADVALPSERVLAAAILAFYADLWGFEVERESDSEIVLRAENFRLWVKLSDVPIERQSLRPLGIEVLSLGEAEQKLIDRQLEYFGQRGLQPGERSLLLTDPAGNWVELSERRTVG